MFGAHIPKTLLHIPEVESVLSGAITAHEFDKEDEKTKFEWIKDFVESDKELVKNNPFNNMIQYGAIGQVMTLLNKKSKDENEIKAQEILVNKVTSMMIPGAMQELAKKQAGGKMDTREPMNNVLSKIPFASKTVPLKEQKAKLESVNKVFGAKEYSRKPITDDTYFINNEKVKLSKEKVKEINNKVSAVAEKIIASDPKVKTSSKIANGELKYKETP